jgi:DNA-binding NtrC family response regulator
MAWNEKDLYMANILVVDDEMGIRELLSEILGDEGHVITTAENAQQARELRAASAPDLVLLDIWMPDTDGVTLLKEWQRDGLLTMPVIMMSGHATIDTAVEATRIGALNFLEKPISLQKLLKAVQQGLSRGQEHTRPATFHARPVLTSVASDTRTVINHSVVSPPVGGITLQPSSLGASATLMSTDTHLFSLSFDLPLREARDAFERAYFEHHLQHEGGSMTRVAEKTGLERTHLYRKLKQLRVEPSKLGKKGG